MTRPNILYHGTDNKGINAILTCRYIGVKYHDCEGVYLTDRIEDALNHGPYVFYFRNDFETSRDKINDGLFYTGRLSIDGEFCIGMFCDIENDKRIIKDIVQFMLDEIRND